MEIEHYIRKIVDEGNRREMEELSDMLVEVVDLIKKYDEDCYKEYVMRLYKMANGNELTREVAQEIVRKMQPTGERWSMQDIQQIQRNYGMEHIKPEDFYVVMNQGYNDFREIFGENIDHYVRYTEAFVNDEDAVADKVFLYFMTIPR